MVARKHYTVRDIYSDHRACRPYRLGGTTRRL